MDNSRQFSIQGTLVTSIEYTVMAMWITIMVDQPNACGLQLVLVAVMGLCRGPISWHFSSSGPLLLDHVSVLGVDLGYVNQKRYGVPHVTFCNAKQIQPHLS